MHSYCFMIPTKSFKNDLLRLKVCKDLQQRCNHGMAKASVWYSPLVAAALFQIQKRISLWRSLTFINIVAWETYHQNSSMYTKHQVNYLNSHEDVFTVGWHAQKQAKCKICLTPSMPAMNPGKYLASFEGGIQGARQIQYYRPLCATEVDQYGCRGDQHIHTSTCHVDIKVMNTH